MIIGTGHRPERLGAEGNPDTWLPAVEYLQHAIEAMAAMGGPQVVVSGMAEGFDLMLAAAALRAKDAGLPVRLVAAVPFRGDVDRFKHDKAKLWHARALQRADEIHVCSDRRFDYKTRNFWMVTQPKHRGVPGILWSCWNGEGGSGTAQTYAMAKSVGLQIDNTFFGKLRPLLLGRPASP